jgi:HK97 family phage portal protein
VKPGLFSRLFASLRAGGWFGPYGFGDKALLDLFGSKPVSSGVTVDENKALTSTVVWACVQLIAGTLGSLPLIHYRRLANGGKERATDTRLYRILHDTPNDDMSASTFAETLTAHVLLWGNAFAEIRRDNRGQVGALWPIEPWRVRGERTEAKELRYVVDGTVKLTPDEMLHIPGLTPDGVWGYSPIQKQREALGLLFASEKFGGTFFGQGSSFGGILTHPGKLTEAAEKNLRNSLEQRAQGVDRAHNFIILQEGLRYDKIGIPPNDAQFLETRKFQVGEISRIFGVPPHMVGDVDRSTSWGTGIEAQNIGFVTYTLRRWLVRFEQEITRKLISPLERKLQFVEFLVDGLLRGDTATRYAAYQVGRNGGWFSANDIRRLENLDPIGDEGDVYLVPSNMVPADRLDEVIDAQTAPPPAPVAPPSSSERARDELEDLREDLETLMQLGREAADRQSRMPLPIDTTAFVERTVEEIKALPPPPLVDLTPVLDKIAAVDQARKADRERMESLLPAMREAVNGDVAALRDVVEQLAPKIAEAMPPPADLAPVMARLDALEVERNAHNGDVAALQDAVEQLVPKLAGAMPPPVQAADLTPVAARLDALEAERRAHADRLAAILPGVQLMIEDVARDFVRRETDRARRAAVSSEKLAAWLEEFYPRQADYAVKVLRGAMQVYTQLVGRPDDAEQDIRTNVAAHITESREALTEILQTPDDDIKETVAHLTARWEAERPAALARALMGAGLVIPVPLSAVVEDDEHRVHPPPPVAPLEPRVVEKEVLERDDAGRAQRVRETATDDGVTLIVEKEVIERDQVGRAQKIRETHTRKK